MEVVVIRPRELESLRSGGQNVELIDVRTPPNSVRFTYFRPQYTVE
jgi:hypothetical protein